MEINNITDSLNELIKEKEKNNNNFEEVEINKIKYFFKDRDNSFKEDIDFAELVASIKKNGLLQPVVLFKTLKGEYYKIAGGRRIEALKTLDYEKVPAIILKEEDYKKEDILKLILEENEKRKDLTKNEKVEFLLKALAYHYIDELELTNLNDDELIEKGKEIFKKIFRIANRKDKNLNIKEEEINIMFLWKQFSEKYNLSVFNFYEDIKLYSLKEPFKEMYLKYKIFNKKTALKINTLIKDKILFILLRDFFNLVLQKIEKEGEISDKLKENLNKITMTIIKNKNIISSQIENKINKLEENIYFKDFKKELIALFVFLNFFKEIDIDEFKNKIDYTNEDINKEFYQQLLEIFNALDLETINFKINKNKELEKKVKQKIRKINKILKNIDIENIELEILEKKIDELINFLEKKEKNNEKPN